MQVCIQHMLACMCVWICLFQDFSRRYVLQLSAWLRWYATQFSAFMSLLLLFNCHTNKLAYVLLPLTQHEVRRAEQELSYIHDDMCSHRTFTCFITSLHWTFILHCDFCVSIPKWCSITCLHGLIHKKSLLRHVSNQSLLSGEQLRHPDMRRSILTGTTRYVSLNSTLCDVAYGFASKRKFERF